MAKTVKGNKKTSEKTSGANIPLGQAQDQCQKPLLTLLSRGATKAEMPHGPSWLCGAGGSRLGLSLLMPWGNQR